MVQVVGVVREDELRGIEHLVGMDFITVEVASEDTSVGVREVEGLLDGDIGELTQHGVEGVVLSLTVVQVATSVLGFSVFAEDSLVEQEGEVVLMSPAWGLEEDTDVDVGHFIVSHVHKRRSEVGLFAILGSQTSWGGSSEATKSLLSQFGELLVANVTSTGDDDVATVVVSLLVLNDLFLSDGGDVFSDTKDGLTEHVVSERSVVRSFDGGFQLVLLEANDFSIDGFSFSFDLVLVVGRVGKNITEDFNSLRDVVLGDGDGVGGGFTGGSSNNLATKVFNFGFELVSGSILGSSKI